MIVDRGEIDPYLGRFAALLRDYQARGVPRVRLTVRLSRAYVGGDHPQIGGAFELCGVPAIVERVWLPKRGGWAVEITAPVAPLLAVLAP